MKKLSKKSKIGKYQTAWEPLGSNVGPISLGTGVSLPEIAGEILGGAGTGLGIAASAPELSLALPFAIATGSIGTGIYNKRHGLYPHQTSPYTTTSVYTPELSDATYVTTPTLSEPRYYSPWGFDIHIGSSKSKTGAPAATQEQTDSVTAARRDSTTTATPPTPQGDQNKNKDKNSDNGGKSSKARKIAPWLIALAAASSYPVRKYVWPLVSSIWTGKYDPNQFVGDEDKKEEKNDENDQNGSIQENFNFGTLPPVLVAPADSIRD